MVKLGLQIAAQLEGVTDLTPVGEDFQWSLKLRCGCGEATDHFVVVTEMDENDVKGGRGTANLVIKCKLCNKSNNMDIVKNSVKAYTADDSPNFKTIVVFECRGVEPIEFQYLEGFTAKGVDTGTTFSEIALEDWEWYDVDEKNKDQVSITEMKHKFVKVK